LDSCYYFSYDDASIPKYEVRKFQLFASLTLDFIFGSLGINLFMMEFNILLQKQSSRFLILWACIVRLGLTLFYLLFKLYFLLDVSKKTLMLLSMVILLLLQQLLVMKMVIIF